MLKENFFRRIYRYSRERFNIWQFIPLTLVISGVLASGTTFLLTQKISVRLLLLTALALLLFFFRLRIFDEFKDYDHDRRFYPERPVPRGLISKQELSLLLIPVIIAELIIAFFFGKNLWFFIISFVYSLLMYQEFFIRDWLKSHFTVYILSHEVLIFPLFFYLCSLNGFLAVDFSNPFFWWLVIYAGLVMFLLEVARKFRSKDMEIDSRDTYSAQYGIAGASFLLAAISISAIIFLTLFLRWVGGAYWLIVWANLFLLIYFFWRLHKFIRKPTSLSSQAVFLSSIIFSFSSCLITIIFLFVHENLR